MGFLLFCAPALEPGDDLLFHRLSDSTIGAVRFHGRVRDGIGWVTDAMVTKLQSRRNNNPRQVVLGGGREGFRQAARLEQEILETVQISNWPTSIADVDGMDFSALDRSNTSIEAI